MDIQELLHFSVQSRASDLHISAQLTPLLRIDGELRKIDVPPLDERATSDLLCSIMSEEQCKQLEQELEVDFSFEIPDVARFRVNVFNQHRGLSGVFRTIPLNVKSFEELGLPRILKVISDYPHGLVLVTGPTGSGKTTTLAAMIDRINRGRHQHIITIEDPIEFVHQSKSCLINQREVHGNTLSFTNALRAALREDPDVILVGEMRDLETIRLAMTAAETGHLVFATLHTISAAKTINRIIDAFPSGEKNMIRSILSESLQAVVSQLLLPRISGGRIATHEIMICNTAIRNLIREDKVPQIYSALQTGGQQGMQTLDQNLQHLVKMQEITSETAQSIAFDKSKF